MKKEAKGRLPWAVIYPPILILTDIGLELKLILSYIAYLAHKPRGCFASNHHLSERFILHNKKVQRSISALRTAGYIKTEYDRPGQARTIRWITLTKKVPRLNIKMYESVLIKLEPKHQKSG